MSRAKNWVYTLNNPTGDEISKAEGLFLSTPGVIYHVFGKETGDSGTFHLQGYVIFSQRKRLGQLREIFPRGHFEVSRGSPHQASDYCKKEGDFKEFGSLPPQAQGKRTDWERLREYVEQLGRRPLERDLILEFPNLVGASYNISHDLHPQKRVANGSGKPTPRIPRQPAIEFIVDPEGNSGKTWFCQYMITQHPDSVQYLRIAKRDDLTFAIDETRTIFLFDVPRGQMEFLQYNVLEQIKDRLIFSPKYSSTLKILTSNVHCVVFSNEEPDVSQLSSDRLRVVRLDDSA
uniref:Putative spliced replication initiation protein n=1 Tax=Didemnum sp. Sea Squirt associated virus TaxID=1692247 RepID=A0A0K1RKZ7_9CIRC|nr:putative spliced replication initiation protein [Didemnum sp. Sea Squirt associated virus]